MVTNKLILKTAWLSTNIPDSAVPDHADMADLVGLDASSSYVLCFVSFLLHHQEGSRVLKEYP